MEEAVIDFLSAIADQELEEADLELHMVRLWVRIRDDQSLSPEGRNRVDEISGRT